jgi:uncharacterized protein (TIGR02444 family)
VRRITGSATRLSPELPDSAFWRFSLELYARDGVPAACLALQDREEADVNLILFALWLAVRGHRLQPEAGQRLLRIAKRWQGPIVGPLRRVRRRLQQEAGLPWAQAVEGWRRRLGEVELAMEQVEQLLLEQALDTVAIGPGDPGAASVNLGALGLARLLGTAEVLLLQGEAFALAQGPPG